MSDEEKKPQEDHAGKPKKWKPVKPAVLRTGGASSVGALKRWPKAMEKLK